jgi:hypothetical protein
MKITRVEPLHGSGRTLHHSGTRVILLEEST